MARCVYPPKKAPTPPLINLDDSDGEYDSERELAKLHEFARLHRNRGTTDSEESSDEDSVYESVTPEASPKCLPKNLESFTENSLSSTGSSGSTTENVESSAENAESSAETAGCSTETAGCSTKNVLQGNINLQVTEAKQEPPLITLDDTDDEDGSEQELSNLHEFARQHRRRDTTNSDESSDNDLMYIDENVTSEVSPKCLPENAKRSTKDALSSTRSTENSTGNSGSNAENAEIYAKTAGYFAENVLHGNINLPNIEIIEEVQNSYQVLPEIYILQEIPCMPVIVKTEGNYRGPVSCSFAEPPTCSLAEPPTCSLEESPACSFVVPPACAFVEPPACSFVEPPACSFVEPPACSFVEPPACSIEEPPTRERLDSNHSFRIKIDHESNGKKSDPVVFNEMENKFYVCKDYPFRVLFYAENVPPGTIIRATPFFTLPEHKIDIVERCPVHKQEDISKGEGLQDHVFQCLSSGAVYEKDAVTRRYSVIVPYERPQDGEAHTAFAYKFTCFSSCPRGINRRPIMVLFTLENQGAHLGSQSLDFKACACPTRDVRTYVERHCKRKYNSINSSHPKDDAHVPKRRRRNCDVINSNHPNATHKDENVSTHSPESPAAAEPQQSYTLTVEDPSLYEFLLEMKKLYETSACVSVKQLKQEGSRRLLR